MGEPFFTIGHSTRTFAEFADLCHRSGIRLLVDVRRHPGSRRCPQFDQDTLSQAVTATGMSYRRAEGLTGRRPVNKESSAAVNAWWQNQSFHNFADHALSADFARALAELRDWGRTSRVAVMCSEAVWWRCHRRIIADHLLAHDEDVRHILGDGRVDTARLSPGAVVAPDGTVTYPLPKDERR